MTEQQALETLTRIFETEFEIDPAKVNADAHLYNDLDLDSLDSVDLIVCLENEFRFKVDRVADGPRLKEMRLVRDIVSYILEKHAVSGV
jgi:acyl carrier protein